MNGSFLGHLPRYGEYPVPFIVHWKDGKPDFRVVDMDKWDQCVRNQLCSICGYKLGEIAFIVGGPITGNSYLFFDPPMHSKCAQYSAEVCPYVSGKKREFSDRTVGVPHTSMADIQPRHADGELFLYKVRTAKVRVQIINGHRLLKAQRIIGKAAIPKIST
jgi:hypothetical protein